MAAKSGKSTAGTARSTPKATPKRATTSSKRRSKTLAITDEMIAERAYHLHLANPEASEVDNWLQAESELRPA